MQHWSVMTMFDNTTTHLSLADKSIVIDRGDILPQHGGCWICHRIGDEERKLDTEFDTYYHPSCLDRVGCDSILEYEQVVDRIAIDEVRNRERRRA